MKKNFLNNNKGQVVKVAKLTKTNTIENGMVVFIGLLLATNFLISLKILFG